MENKNAVPDGDERAGEPAAGQAGERAPDQAAEPAVDEAAERAPEQAGEQAPDQAAESVRDQAGVSTSGPAPLSGSRLPDSDIPEFLKGPDPEDTDPVRPGPGTASGEVVTARDETASTGTPGEAAMRRDDWESAFEDASGPEADNDSADTPRPGSTEHAVRTDEASSAEPRTEVVRTDEARVDEASAAPEGETPLAAAVAADHDASHTEALPAWDQEDSGTRALPTTQHEAAEGPTQSTPSNGAAPAGPALAGAGSAAAAAGEMDRGQIDDRSAAGEQAAAGADESQRTDAVAAAKRRGGTPRNPGLDADPEAQRRHEAREAALTAKPVFARVVQTLLAIAFPFMLVIAAIRAVASPWFLWLDYHRPGFPADLYGFTQAERLTYGNYGVDYINNSAPSAYLGNLMDANGHPLFLATEVSHMADVKAVIGATYAAGAILFVLAVLVCLYLGRRYAGGMRRAFFAGSVATLVVMIALTVLAVLNFQTFFTDFHELFFSQGNWTFHANDTLIRLYPTQFWVDAGIVIAALVLVTSLIFLITTWPTRRRRERSRLLQVNRDLGLD